jgi:hypothetical protein
VCQQQQDEMTLSRIPSDLQRGPSLIIGLVEIGTGDRFRRFTDEQQQQEFFEDWQAFLQQHPHYRRALPAPADITETRMFELIKRCWHADPHRRPLIAEILADLEEWSSAL